MDSTNKQDRSLFVRFILGFAGVLSGGVTAFIDFIISSLIFEADPLSIGYVDMFPAALIGFVLFLPVILVPLFLLRKKIASFAWSHFISGLLMMIIVFVYLSSIRYYY